MYKNNRILYDEFRGSLSNSVQVTPQYQASFAQLIINEQQTTADTSQGMQNASASKVSLQDLSNYRNPSYDQMDVLQYQERMLREAEQRLEYERRMMVRAAEQQIMNAGGLTFADFENSYRTAWYGTVKQPAPTPKPAQEPRKRAIEETTGPRRAIEL